MQPEIFMDWVGCLENVFAHKPMTDVHKVALVATEFRRCATLQLFGGQICSDDREYGSIGTWVM